MWPCIWQSTLKLWKEASWQERPELHTLRLHSALEKPTTTLPGSRILSPVNSLDVHPPKGFCILHLDGIILGLATDGLAVSFSFAITSRIIGLLRVTLIRGFAERSSDSFLCIRMGRLLGTSQTHMSSPMVRSATDSACIDQLRS